MNIAFDGDGHVRETLGLYFMGGLADEDQTAVERHLARCDRCLAEYDDAGEFALYLSALTESDAEVAGDESAPPAPHANDASRATRTTQGAPLS
jgi:predicted anti-sigma-YlaC factor YlaD